jgi:hypothetical protein
MKMKPLTVVVFILIAVGGFYAYQAIQEFAQENDILKQVVARLESDSRVAEVLVTGVNFNENDQKTYTTIKFLEYAVDDQPLDPKYFSFTGNIIQFQSLIIRFEDIHVREAHRLRGKSAYLFWKVFMLDGPNTQEYVITKVNEIPQGYQLEGAPSAFEKKLWSQFWDYAVDPEKAKHMGVKNAQIEAPGTVFIPGYLYTIKIEHDGGLRIEAAALSPILKGERIF